MPPHLAHALCYIFLINDNKKLTAIHLISKGQSFLAHGFVKSQHALCMHLLRYQLNDTWVKQTADSNIMGSLQLYEDVTETLNSELDLVMLSYLINKLKIYNKMRAIIYILNLPMANFIEFFNLVTPSAPMTFILSYHTLRYISASIR